MAEAQDLPGSVDAAQAANPSINPLYRDLAQQHHSLEARLHDLAALAHLSTEQHLEEVKLKKKKLAVKDQMASLLAAARG